MECELHGVIYRRAQWLRDAKPDGETASREKQAATKEKSFWLADAFFGSADYEELRGKWKIEMGEGKILRKRRAGGNQVWEREEQAMICGGEHAEG
jgi:hypothetical protein